MEKSLLSPWIFVMTSFIEDIIPVTRSWISYGTGIGGWSSMACCISSQVFSSWFTRIFIWCSQSIRRSMMTLSFRQVIRRPSSSSYKSQRFDRIVYSPPDPVVPKRVCTHIKKPHAGLNFVIQLLTFALRCIDVIYPQEFSVICVSWRFLWILRIIWPEFWRILLSIVKQIVSK